MKQYLLDRLQEPSTWRGCILILTALGCALTPEQKEAIAFVGAIIAGAIGVMTKDKGK